MLKNKIFASNAVYCCILHDDKILKKYFDIMNDVFLKISKFEKKDDNLIKELETRTCLGGIRESNK